MCQGWYVDYPSIEYSGGGGGAFQGGIHLRHARSDVSIYLSDIGDLGMCISGAPRSVGEFFRVLSPVMCGMSEVGWGLAFQVRHINNLFMLVL